MISWSGHLVTNGWQAAFMEPEGLNSTDGKPLWMFFMLSSFAKDKVGAFPAVIVSIVSSDLNHRLTATGTPEERRSDYDRFNTRYLRS
jgi:hypothetical protein